MGSVSIWTEGVGPSWAVRESWGLPGLLSANLPPHIPLCSTGRWRLYRRVGGAHGAPDAWFSNLSRGLHGVSGAPFRRVHPVRIKPSLSLGVQPGDGAALRRPVATLPVESSTRIPLSGSGLSPSLLSPSVQIGLLYPCGISVHLVLAGSSTGGWASGARSSCGKGLLSQPSEAVTIRGGGCEAVGQPNPERPCFSGRLRSVDCWPLAKNFTRFLGASPVR
jgi:hypothetical protein